ncbi:MAG: hypothetical protein M1819_006476 [Sarea resinae]|nr:MAG: hypothetical protein M1819_006476 [Sarea resinae]
MSVSQTYFLANTARGKLSQEASRADHNLRLLVGHANLLDTLVLELADVEEEQERWLDQTVQGANKATEQAKHIRWADTIVEEPEEDWDAADADSSDMSDSESDEDMDDQLYLATAVPQQKAFPSPTVTEVEIDSDEEYEDDEDQFGELALTRTSSSSQPPELLHDSDEDSDDDSMPPSPPQPSLPPFSEKQRQQIATTSFYDNVSAQAVSSNTSLSTSQSYSQGLIPERTNPQQLVSAY